MPQAPAGVSAFREASRTPRQKCAIAELHLTPDQQESLNEAFADRVVTGKGISIVLGSWGCDVPQNTVTRHRRGDCSCGR